MITKLNQYIKEAYKTPDDVKHLLYKKKFEDGEIIVSLINDRPNLIFGHRYIADYSRGYFSVKDIIDNSTNHNVLTNNFLPEIDFEFGDYIEAFDV